MFEDKIRVEVRVTGLGDGGRMYSVDVSKEMLKSKSYINIISEKVARELRIMIGPKDKTPAEYTKELYDSIYKTYESKLAAGSYFDSSWLKAAEPTMDGVTYDEDE